MDKLGHSQQVFKKVWKIKKIVENFTLFFQFWRPPLLTDEVQGDPPGEGGVAGLAVSETLPDLPVTLPAQVGQPQHGHRGLQAVLPSQHWEGSRKNI